MALLDRVAVDPQRVTRGSWFLQVPAIAAVARDGLDLAGGVTVLVGENGAGKSTLVEAVARSWQQSIRSAADDWAPAWARSPEDTPLWQALLLAGDRPRSHGGCFLRAEAMHGVFAGMGQGETGRRAYGGGLNERSHGEGFLAYLQARTSERGLFVLDEPEAALSFTSCLQLLGLLGGLVEAGSQVLLATHSPVLAAFPGATVLELGEDGITRRDWADLELVAHWRTFLRAPEAYLRHLF